MSESGTNETLFVLADELAAIGRRLTEVSATLRTHLDASQPVQQPTPQTPPEPRRQPEAQRQPEPQRSEPHRQPQPPMPPAAQSPPTSTRKAQARRFGAQWAPSRVLAWAGGAVTLLGVVFLLVLAAQRGWLRPEVRVGGGAALAVVLIVTGWFAHRRPGGKAGGYALAATGFAALYLDTVAATSLYRYLPVPGGLGAALAVAVAGLVLADRWRAQELAVGVVLGCAVCAPMITREPNAVLTGFLLLLQVAAAPVQVRHGWRRLALTSAIPSVSAALVADAWAVRLPADRGATLAAVIGVAVVGVAVASITAGARPGSDGAAIAVLVASPAPALLAAPLLDRTAAGFLAAGVAALLIALWAGARFTPAFRNLLSPRFATVAGGAGTVAALQATMTFADSSLWATALLCEALLLTLGARQLRGAGALLGALCYAAVGFLVALSHEIRPAVLLGESPGAGVRAVLVGLLIAAAAVAIPLTASRLGRLARSTTRSRLLWTFAGVLALYGAASATMALALLVRADRDGFLTGHVLITLSWVLAAIALLLRGIRATRLRVAGMVLIAVSLAKLFLFDLGQLDGFARVVAFLCAGLVLLAAGVRYARLVNDQQEST